MEQGFVLIEVVNGAEGPSLCVGDEDSGYRIAGPKPWGGGRTIHRFTVKADELRKQLDEYAPAGRLAADIEAACTLLEAKEYAEHWATTGLGKRLEAALTEVHNDAAIQRDALRAVAEAVAEETTSWVANQHTLGVPNDAPDLDAIIDRVMAERGCL